MNGERIKPILYSAIMALQDSMNDALTASQIEQISDRVKRYALVSAVSSGLASAVPGVAVLTVVTQTGLVWALYLQINKTIGISTKENVLKFLGSAVMTNLITNFGAQILTLVGASVMSCLLGAGTLVSFVMGACVGYVCIYTAAIVYLNLLTRVKKEKGTFDFSDTETLKRFVKNVMEGMNIKEAIKEARESFHDARKSGAFREARRNPKCPNPECGASVSSGQKFCSHCGSPLK